MTDAMEFQFGKKELEKKSLWNHPGKKHGGGLSTPQTAER